MRYIIFEKNYIIHTFCNLSGKTLKSGVKSVSVNFFRRMIKYPVQESNNDVEYLFPDSRQVGL